MNKRYYILLAFLSVLALFVFNNNVTAQEEELITVESVVNDDQGNPVPNAAVYADESFARTDAEGKFSIKVATGSKIVIDAKGFESLTVSLAEIKTNPKLMMKKAKVEGGERIINIAFRKSKASEVVGIVSNIRTDEVNSYDNGIWADDILTGRTLGMIGSNNIRGLGIGINVADLTGSGLYSGNTLFVVDGLPRDIESLKLTEIESITVLKDVNASVLYGSAAVNGVVLITTKRGEAYKKKTNFAANYGISTPRTLPKYLNSADYMTYFNQARANDGFAPQFPDATIENYRTGNKYRYPNIDYYSDEYMKSFKSYFDLSSEFSGGNEVARYYSNVGWYSAGGILDFGEAAKARNNILNVRGNVDLKINDWIKTSIDGSSIFVNNRSQRGSFWNAAANYRPNEYTPLIPFDLIPADNALLLGRKNDVNGQYLLGGNVTYPSNPIADSYAGGVVESIIRKFSFNNRVDFDLNRITQGLSFHTNISFDYLTGYSQTVANSYSIYEPVWDPSEDKITSLIQRGTDTRTGIQVVGGTYFHRRFGFYGLLSYDREFDGIHHITGSLIGYGSNFKEQGDFQGVRHSHAGLQLGYTLNNKYVVDFSGVYINSVKLPEGNRGGFSPTLGVAWVISSEDFMSSLSSINLLKLKVTGGILNSDLPIGGFFYYDNRYAGSGSYAWNEGVRSRGGVQSSWSDNPDLGFAKRKEINVGLEGLFFNKLIGTEINLFHDVYSDLVSRPSVSYPSYYSDFIPFENFASDKYNGAEIGLSLNKALGNWNFYLAATAMYVTSERVKVDEIYRDAYQRRQGRPVDATFGLESVGLFKDQTDIDNSPFQTFGTVKPGDIKYKDQNGDNVIDANDEIYLRRYQAPFSGGLQIKIDYRNISLYILGEGRTGADNFREGNYYWVDGNDKYSDIVRSAWTPETAATATYPRLSSTANNNNFRRSSYWLYNNDYFQIRKIQLTWKMPSSIVRPLLMKNIDLFVDASDVFQFAKNLDIRDVRVGGEPYYRTFSVGVKANF